MVRHGNTPNGLGPDKGSFGVKFGPLSRTSVIYLLHLITDCDKPLARESI
jgi:hypothetical protein